MSGNGSAWVKAELLARRVYQLTTLPMRSENHPTWGAAIHNALSAIGSGEPTMERALAEIDRLTKTL
jgi:hypothetical protein